MRTKVLDSREIYDGINSMLYVKDAIAYRVDDLMSLLAFLSSATSSSDADPIDLHRQLFSTKVGHQETIPKLCRWNGHHFFHLLSTLPFDGFVF
jgi:hypothetical protein